MDAESFILAGRHRSFNAVSSSIEQQLERGPISSEEMSEFKRQLNKAAKDLIAALEVRIRTTDSFDVRESCTDSIEATRDTQSNLAIRLTRNLQPSDDHHHGNHEASLVHSTFQEVVAASGQLREPKVQKFSGDIKNWPTFRDLFLSEVHNRYPDDVTKLIYLQELCVGDAKRALGQWQPTAANYQLAWDTLCARYNDERAIKQASARVLTTLPVIREETSSGLRLLIDRTDNALRQLSAAGCPTGQWDELIISKWTECLPDKTYVKWRRHCGSRTNIVYKELRDFVEVEARACEEIDQRHNRTNNRVGRRDDRKREYVRDQQRRRSNSGERQRRDHGSNRRDDGPAARRTNRNRQFDNRRERRIEDNIKQENRSRSPPAIKMEATKRPASDKCAMCGERHQLWACKNFRALSVQARQAEVAKHGHCGRCLRSHGGVCRSEYNCKKCKGAHSTLLCNKPGNGGSANRAVAGPQ